MKVAFSGPYITPKRPAVQTLRSREDRIVRKPSNGTHFFPIQYRFVAVRMKIWPSEIAGELRQ